VDRVLELALGGRLAADRLGDRVDAGQQCDAGDDDRVDERLSVGVRERAPPGVGQRAGCVEQRGQAGPGDEQAEEEELEQVLVQAAAAPAAWAAPSVVVVARTNRSTAPP